MQALQNEFIRKPTLYPSWNSQMRVLGLSNHNLILGVSCTHDVYIFFFWCHFLDPRLCFPNDCSSLDLSLCKKSYFLSSLVQQNQLFLSSILSLA